MNTTRDPGVGPAGSPSSGAAGASPAQLDPLIAQVPRAGEVPSHPSAAASTPGLALAGARVPGGPSLPELDPMSLTQVVSQLANELFSAPPAPGGRTGPVGA